MSLKGGIGGLALMIVVAAAIAQDDARAIVERSVEATRADWRAAPQYSYKDTDRERGGSKTYEVHMLDGSPYRQTIAVDRNPLAPEEQRQEQEKFDQAVAERGSESRQEKDKRIEEYDKERQRDHSMLIELTRAFNFRLIGETNLNGYQVYVIRATPRHDYIPPNAEGRVLTGMQGSLWIDKRTYQWVKVTARVIHPVSIEGFLARVEPGTYFELEKMPVDKDVWLPTHFQMKSRARILGFWSRTGEENDTFFDYHKEHSG